MNDKELMNNLRKNTEITTINEYLNKIHHADCLDFLPNIPDDSVDCFFSDIPYKVSSGGASKSSAFGSKNKWEKLGDVEKLDLYRKGKIFKENDINPEEYLPEIFRIMKDGSHGYIMVNSRNLLEVGKTIEEQGFTINNILVMRKNNCVTNQWYMKNIEFTIFFRKGCAKPLNNCGLKSCIDVFMSNLNKIHPTQKPVDYFSILIQNSTKKNDIVLDCFSGSGTTAIACHNLKRNFICIEKDKEYYEASVKRLEDHKKRLTLF